MVQLKARALPYVNELRKRAARELGLGHFTTEEYEEFCKHLEAIKGMVVKLDKEQN